ncbi:MAG: hypothetical protein U0M42_07895 [Acutalibacteraceae bacterium]|nr:hypothetical protein [Acutalibacteraceae bacterium]
MILCVLCFSGCGSKAVYRIDSLKYVVDGNASVTYDYTYTPDHQPAITNVRFISGLGESYTDVYGYNEKGQMITFTKRYESSIERSYKAESITNNKYIFREDDGSEFSTIIFDKTGFIVSQRYANGYVTEYAFTYDEKGKPLTFKQLDIRPSGSSLITDYKVEFVDKETFRMIPIGENAQEGVYYEAHCTIIK